MQMHNKSCYIGRIALPVSVLPSYCTVILNIVWKWNDSNNGDIVKEVFVEIWAPSLQKNVAKCQNIVINKVILTIIILINVTLSL